MEEKRRDWGINDCLLHCDETFQWLLLEIFNAAEVFKENKEILQNNV